MSKKGGNKKILQKYYSSGTKYETWDDYWNKCTKYIKSEETRAWLHRAEAMRLVPPRTTRGVHGSGNSTDDASHVTDPLRIYVPLIAQPAWKELDEEDREQLIEFDIPNIRKRRP